MNKIENLKLKDLEKLENQDLRKVAMASDNDERLVYVYIDCPDGIRGGCQSRNNYTITSTPVDGILRPISITCHEGGSFYCAGYGDSSNPIGDLGNGSGNGSGTSNNSGNGSGRDPWTPTTQDYCRWCIWASCYSASGSGSGFFSSNPVGSGNSDYLDIIFQSYGSTFSTGTGTVSASIFIPKKFSPPNTNNYANISTLRIRCCSKKLPAASFKVGLQKEGYGYPLHERTQIGMKGYTEFTFPFTLNYNADTRATVYFSTEDHSGGIFSWELLR